MFRRYEAEKREEKSKPVMKDHINPFAPSKAIKPLRRKRLVSVREYEKNIIGKEQ